MPTLPEPDVGMSALVYNVEHTSFHFGPSRCKFVLRSFCECQGFCTMSKLATHRGVVHMCLQADDNVAFEDTSCSGFDVCHPAYHDSSLYTCVLVTFHEAAVLLVSM